MIVAYKWIGLCNKTYPSIVIDANDVDGQIHLIVKPNVCSRIKCLIKLVGKGRAEYSKDLSWSKLVNNNKNKQIISKRLRQVSWNVKWPIIAKQDKWGWLLCNFCKGTIYIFTSLDPPSIKHQLETIEPIESAHHLPTFPSLQTISVAK